MPNATSLEKSQEEATQTDKTSLDISSIHQIARQIRQQVERVIVGKGEVVELMLVALLCEGHILLEDVPGTGKTTLAKTLARSIGGEFNRIQFTPDLLPSCLTNVIMSLNIVLAP